MLTLGNSKLILFFLITDFAQVTVILLSLVKTCHEKNPNPLRLMKCNNHTYHLAQVIFNDSVSRNQELVYSVNKLALKVQSFIFFCNTFFRFLWQNKICMIRRKTKRLTELRKYLLNGYLFDSICIAKSCI